jgi:MFS family permease
VYITAGLLVLGLSTALLGLVAAGDGGIWLALPAILGVGLGLGGIVVPARVVLQRRPPREVRARVIATQLALSNAASILPLLLGGSLADRWGIPPVMAGLGVVTLLAGVAGVFLLRAGDR